MGTALQNLIKLAGSSGQSADADQPVPAESTDKRKGMPLSSKMFDMLCAQYTAEEQSAQIYYGMSAYFEDSHLAGLASYFRKSAEEEHCHAMKIFDYLAKCNELIKMGSIGQVKTDYTSVQDVAREFLTHEQEVTRRINAIAEQAKADGDYATFTFIQWFVSEQLEEVRKAEDFSKHAQLIGQDGTGLLIMDERYSE